MCFWKEIKHDDLFSLVKYFFSPGECSAIVYIFTNYHLCGCQQPELSAASLATVLSSSRTLCCFLYSSWLCRLIISSHFCHCKWGIYRLKKRDLPRSCSSKWQNQDSKPSLTLELELFTITLISSDFLWKTCFKLFCITLLLSANEEYIYTENGRFWCFFSCFPHSLPLPPRLPSAPPPPLTTPSSAIALPATVLPLPFLTFLSRNKLQNFFPLLSEFYTFLERFKIDSCQLWLHERAFRGYLIFLISSGKKLIILNESHSL